MGYNHAAAFLPVLPRPKFFHPFEGPVKGFPPKTATEAIHIAKANLALLDLRVFWINGFVELVRIINPAIGKAKALDWVASIHGFPASEADLRESMESGRIAELAERCARELSAKP